MKYLKDFNNVKTRMEAYWNFDFIDRCCLSIKVMPADFVSVSEQFTPKEMYSDPEVFDLISRHMYDNTKFFAEAIPSRHVDFGTSAQCEMFGCKQKYARDTVWFDPILDEPNIDKLNVNMANNAAFERQKALYNELVKRANGDYFIGMSDNCGNIDALTCIRGTQEMLIDMLDEPEFVTEAIKRIIDVWKISEHEYFNIIKENNFGGCTHGWMQLWADKIHTQLQCDFSVMISEAMFEEFALPELESCAKAVDYCTYHLDGVEQLRHLDMILSVKEINNIQWTPVAGQPKTSCSIEALQKIQKAGKGLVLVPALDELEFILNNLSHKGLQLIIHGVKDEGTAKDIIALAKKCAVR